MLEGLSKPLPNTGYCKVAHIAESLEPDDRKSPSGSDLRSHLAR